MPDQVSPPPDLLVANLLELSSDAILVRDLNGRLTYWNHGAELLYGWNAVEALGQIVNTLLATEFPPLDTPLDAVLVRDGSWEGDLTRTRRDGRRIIVESRQFLIRDAADRPASILESNRDITDRRQIELTRGQLAAIVESSDDAILSKTLDGIITSWNGGAERLYGYSASEVIGRPVSILIPPERPDELPAIMEQIRRGERIEHYEAERIARDGRRLVVSVTISPIRDSAGRVIGASAVAREITARWHADADLRTSRDQFRDILQNAADGITVQEKSGALVYANAAAARLVGYASSEALLAAPRAAIARRFEVMDDAGHLLPIEQLPGRRALRDAQPSEAVLRYRVLDTPRGMPNEYWSVVRATPVLDASGQAQFAVSVFQDITALKREEARLRFLEEASTLLAATLDYEVTLAQVAQLAVPGLADWASVDIVDVDGAIRRLAVAHVDPAKIAWAHELERRFPADPNASTGVPQVIRSGEPEFYPVIPAELLEAAALDDELRQILDELHLVSAITVPLQARGTTLGAITFVYAESERHYTEADLRFARQLAARAALAVDNARLYRDALAALRVRDEFLSSISHDLRTPLTTIRGLTQLALRRLQRIGAAGGETVSAPLANVDLASEKMAKMIDSLLDLARLESGRPLDLDRQRMDILSLARELIDEHQRGAPSHQIQLRSELGRLDGYWDPVRLERVLDNLLSNAIKYSPDGGSVTLTVERERDAATDTEWACVTVDDEGIGIPAADLPTIFERFRRGSNVPVHVRGAGIGLAGASQIVQQHRGTLTVASTEGRGSRFTLRLPVGSESEELTEDQTEET